MEREGLSSGGSAPPASPAGRRRIFVTALTLAWVLAVGGFFHWIWKYQTTAGAAAAAPQNWPAATSIPFDKARPTLVMFLHPFCSCSRASLTELQEVVARNPGKLDVSVLLLPSPVKGTSTQDSGLWEMARAIPGVHLRADEEGTEARRFGARTSGQVTLYGRDGQLMFSGGITESRGHAGNNVHLAEMLSLVSGGGASGVRLAPVYGCSLGNSART
jgi:hypothetical protein